MVNIPLSGRGVSSSIEMAHRMITQLPHCIHALSLVAALGAGAFVAPIASAAETKDFQVYNRYITAEVQSKLGNTDGQQGCAPEDFRITDETLEVLLHALDGNRVTVKLIPLYEGSYAGDGADLYVLVQYFTPDGQFGNYVTFSAFQMSVERSEDGAMLATVTLPEEGRDGYYSISAMDMATLDQGYGEFKKDGDILNPYVIPRGDDSNGDPEDASLDTDRFLNPEELAILEKARTDALVGAVPALHDNTTLRLEEALRAAQIVREIPGALGAPRSAISLTPPMLSVRYTEVYSGAEVKPVTISASGLPVHGGGYDLMVVETDMDGIPRGEALSYTHMPEESISEGKFEVIVGMPGSLLKTDSVYTAYLLYAENEVTDTAVATVRFGVIGDPGATKAVNRAGGTSSLPAESLVAPSSPNRLGVHGEGSQTSAVAEGPSATSSSSATSSVSIQTPSSSEDLAERHHRALETLAQAPTMAPTAVVSAHTSVASALSPEANTASQTAHSSETAGRGSEAMGATSSFRPGVISRLDGGNTSATKVHVAPDTTYQEGVKAVASADSVTEQVPDRNMAFWFIGLTGLGLAVGAAWMAYRRDLLSLRDLS